VAYGSSPSPEGSKPFAIYLYQTCRTEGTFPQLMERIPRTEERRGSNPLSSSGFTNRKTDLKISQAWEGCNPEPLLVVGPFMAQ
jgi:hypothetical protein